MGPLTFLRFVSLPGMCVSGAAAEPERLQEAVRASARAGAGAGAGVGTGVGAGVGTGVGGSGRRNASQFYLNASWRGGAAAHVQRRAYRQLRRPGPDPQDGEPSGFSPAVQSAAAGRPAERTGAEAAHEAVWVRNSG